MLAVGDALGDALVRPGGVVVHLVFRQDGAQMPLTDDQHAVEQLVAQGADEALAGSVRSGSLDGGAQDRGAGCLEDGIEGTGEVRSAIADQESDVLEPFVETDRQVAGCRAKVAAHQLSGLASLAELDLRTPDRMIME